MIHSGARNLLYLRQDFFTVGAVVGKGTLNEVKIKQYRQVDYSTLWLKLRKK